MRHPIKDGNINSEVFIEFIKHLNRERPLILQVDHASFHKKTVCDFVHQHRSKLRIFFLPKHVLEETITFSFSFFAKKYKRIISFFQLPDTQYAAQIS